jgi:hypothetical protein
MRPYLLLLAVLLISALAFGQHPVPPAFFNGSCYYGCGPFVPLVTTPMVSLQNYSPNPVGARNATTGLIAGATNGTLSQLSGQTSSTFTVPVWYQGGDAPFTAPNIRLFPEPIMDGHMAHMFHPEHGAREETRAEWTYFAGREHTASAVEASAAVKGGKKAQKTYTNDDVERQNQKNGDVKYDGKTEKL